MQTSSTYLICLFSYAKKLAFSELLSFFCLPVLSMWEELFSILQPEQAHEGSLWRAPVQMCLLQ